MTTVHFADPATGDSLCGAEDPDRMLYRDPTGVTCRACHDLAPSPRERVSDRSQIGKIAAHAKWATCDDRSAATQPARDGMTRKFEREVDPDGRLAPDVLAQRVDSARRAHYQRMALRSAQSRRAKKQQRGGGAAEDRPS